MIVWNMGSILIDLLAGKHVLDSYEIIKVFADSDYNLQTIGIKKEIQEETREFIKRSLAFDPENRMSVEELFKYSFIKYRIEES